MRILLSGGGTGGHIQPALAVADAFRCRFPDAKIGFCGKKGGMEEALVAKEGYPFFPIEIQGLRRSLSLSNIKTVYLTLRAFSCVNRLLSEFQPDLVIGTGGYVCYPLLRCAAKKKIPCAIHESNAIPGLATKLLGKSVDAVFTNFEQTAQHLPRAKKIYCVGNPLRSTFFGISTRQARAKLAISDSYPYFLLSYGGSLGAEHLNDAVLSYMEQYGKDRRDLYHIHVCGKRDYARIQERFEAAGLCAYPHLQLREYLYDLPLYLCAATLVLCRAGAMSLSEVAQAQKPSILVPSPYVTHNHQYHNAMVFANAGASLCMEEQSCTAQALARAVHKILCCESTYRSMAQAAASLAKSNAANDICDILLRMIKI